MIPLNWNQIRPDLSQDIKEFILTCLEVNEQKRAQIEQLTNLNYMRRLHQGLINNPLNSTNRFDFRLPSKSFHQPVNSLT